MRLGTRTDRSLLVVAIAGGAVACTAVTLSIVMAVSADDGTHRVGWITLALAFLLIGLLQTWLAEGLAHANEIEIRLIEAAGKPIVEVDAAGTILRANGEARRLLGREGELAGTPLATFVPLRLREAYDLARQGYVAEPQFSTITGVELAVRRDDGTEVPVEVTLAPIRSGSRLRVRLGITDISERVRIDEALRKTAVNLERSNAELEAFASIASHDLREPLRTLSGFAHLLEQQHSAELDDEGRGYVDHIVESSRRMQNLINDLLEYTHVGRQVLHLCDVDVQELVESAVGSLGQVIDDTGADIVVHRLPTVCGDASALSQVFLNLLGNALKFRGADRLRVDISATKCQDYWRFVVADNGIGIEPRYGERVFKMFQRLHGQEEYDGTGMGLAICHRVIERHGGNIWFDESPGGGTTFTFTLLDAQG